MNWYKVAFRFSVFLIYAIMFWVAPIYLEAPHIYILKVLILHGMIVAVLTPILFLSWLAAMAENTKNWSSK